ncbi:hypothetical protein LTR99_009075 [Exophiala xenobiotica]|uniref:Kinase n=1 Tax=Vermiconidia calcicola TaxID=1690605 RepID=A0AAV9PZU3_9PEZI|nr:hypothetical protein LTR96_009668 [Exophiala xenobiotica]KAK5532341.1 hypothetical protein LTR25_007874 [Vermiconidia calcicola]KAK5541879.1 hypothetical protein LTR23_005481 [Chaetothyriales sp. CCFEE 6169]KAK5295486.1 hypothetical protein LTR99_009075 [Exophiala xenobiotica]KAK5333714.1 hypothetical protein LTR98_010052 [Exophiala xenobiotica]
MAMTPAPANKKVVAMPAESELIAFDHSAAGHQGISSNASGSLIIKPCTQAEIDFYESAKDHPLFQAHIPTFIGSLSQHEDQDAIAPLLDATTAGTGTGPVNGTSTSAAPGPGLSKRVSWKPSGGKKLSTGLAVVLENVAAGFKYPNVLDVKLGARLWADDAPPSKRQKLDELANRTTTGTLGFRVAGMKIRHHHEEEEHDATHQKKEEEEEDPAHVQIKSGYKSYAKYYGQSFSQHTVVDAFTTYLGGVHTDPSTGKKVFRRKRARVIVQRFIRELESIQYVLENEESRMYSASVLMVYEGDDEALEVAIEQEQKEKEQEVPMDNEMVDGDDGDEDGEEDDDEDDEDDDDDEVSPPKVHEVRLIDFAHASWTPGQGPDENMLMGVKSILRILKDLV